MFKSRSRLENEKYCLFQQKNNYKRIVSTLYLLQNKQSDQNMNVRHFSSGSSCLNRAPRHTSDDFSADRRLDFSCFPIEEHQRKRVKYLPPPPTSTFRKKALVVNPSIWANSSPYLVDGFEDSANVGKKTSTRFDASSTRTIVASVLLLLLAATMVTTTHAPAFSIHRFLRLPGVQQTETSRKLSMLENTFLRNRQLTEENDALIRSNEDLSRSIFTLRDKIESTTASLVATENERIREALPLLKRRNRVIQRQINYLVDTVQAEANQSVLEHYGEGPHRVKFTVQLPGLTKSMTFTIELAPTQQMPHTVEVFLDQVYHELWVNCTFSLNTGTAVHASTKSRREEFERLGLSTVRYPEYSEDFSHKEWTVAFARNSPGFYVNMVDNTDQQQVAGHFKLDHQVLTYGIDPCFGKVVDGHETLEKISQLPTTDHHILKHPVRILRSEIL